MAKCGKCHEVTGRCRCGDKKEIANKDAERAARLNRHRTTGSRPCKS